MEFTSSSPWPTSAAPDLDRVTYTSPALTGSRWTFTVVLIVIIPLILYRAVFGDAKSPVRLSLIRPGKSTDNSVFPIPSGPQLHHKSHQKTPPSMEIPPRRTRYYPSRI